MSHRHQRLNMPTKATSSDSSATPGDAEGAIDDVRRTRSQIALRGGRRPGRLGSELHTGGLQQRRRVPVRERAVRIHRGVRPVAAVMWSCNEHAPVFARIVPKSCGHRKLDVSSGRRQAQRIARPQLQAVRKGSGDQQLAAVEALPYITIRLRDESKPVRDCGARSAATSVIKPVVAVYTGCDRRLAALTGASRGAWVTIDCGKGGAVSVKASEAMYRSALPGRAQPPPTAPACFDHHRQHRRWRSGPPSGRGCSARRDRWRSRSRTAISARCRPAEDGRAPGAAGAAPAGVSRAAPSSITKSPANPVSTPPGNLNASSRPRASICPRR